MVLTSMIDFSMLPITLPLFVHTLGQAKCAASVVFFPVSQDKANNTSLARHLDLREIWRLVQKDVETEYLDNQVRCVCVCVCVCVRVRTGVNMSDDFIILINEQWYYAVAACTCIFNIVIIFITIFYYFIRVAP